MNKLFKTKNFLIIEVIILILVVINIFIATSRIGDCAPPNVYPSVSCSEKYGPFLIGVFSGLFVLYLITFVIYRIIKLIERREFIKFLFIEGVILLFAIFSFFIGRGFFKDLFPTCYYMPPCPAGLACIQAFSKISCGILFGKNVAIFLVGASILFLLIFTIYKLIELIKK